MRSFLLACALISSPALAGEDGGLPPAATETVDFVRDIRPIFEAKCLKCHGPEKRKGDYRLDVKQTALTGGEDHAPNIHPGKSAESPLIQFVAGLDPDIKMPPKGEPLSPREIGLLRAWIDQGAVWPEVGTARRDPLDWWSLRPLQKPAVPATAAQSGAGFQPVTQQPPAEPAIPAAAKVHNPIDAFIAAKLAANGLSPAPEADARTLCRRLYFDLTGLPPTPEETQSFVAASPGHAEAAYERLVDQLLASPRYGERWARHWLDVVHYGDTHGYDKDKQRPNAWPYRDYVIRAFNEDKPYARFVQEQIAGDVIYPGTRDGIEALGFVAAGPWDYIGHAEVPEDKIDGKIARHLDRDDMVATTMGTFCSATVQCAQCHNHKFDPFTQEDYYSIQAVFAAIDRADKSYDLDPAIGQRRAQLTARQRTLEQTDKELTERLRKAAGPRLAELDAAITSAEKAASQGRRPEYGWHSAIAPQPETTKWVQVDLGKSISIDRVVLAGCWDDFNGIGAGFGFPVRFRVEASDDPEFRGVPIVVAAHDLEDYTNPGTAPQSFAAGGKSARYLRVTATKLASRKNDFIFALAEIQIFDAAGQNAALGAAVSSLDSIESPVRWTRKNLTDGIYPAATGGERLAELRTERDALLDGVTDEPTKRDRKASGAALAEVKKQIGALPKPLTVYAGTVHTGSGTFKGTGAEGGKPRPIFILTRGQVTLPGREVGPGALAVLSTLPARFALPAESPEGERRAALARWITDERNPLTWRSIVNRVWQYHFGRGLVETPNDFGRMGAAPTHPELLDWLASEFRDHGGSLKWLHKLIVTSSTYRQSSAPQHEICDCESDDGSVPPSLAAAQRAAAIDANNALLWRQNRRKLEAEAIRDSVLAASGELDLTMGGPGWQDFVVEHPEHSPHYEYGLADPADRKTWRRSIYRFIVRSQMQPFMTSLDCADPSMRVDRRNESVSPQQALALLNNGFMVVQAQRFAARVEREAGADPAKQVARAFALALDRAPSPEESAKLSPYARQFGLPNLCRLLFNLNEFAFVD